MKVCCKRDCRTKGDPQPLANFSRNRSASDGLQKWCKDCFKRIPYTPTRRAVRAAYSTSEVGKRLMRTVKLKNTYGISFQEFEMMIEAQSGLCGICTRPMQPGRLTHIDHDHTTGKIRGLLCHFCNVGIGMLGESQLLLSGAQKYLAAS